MYFTKVHEDAIVQYCNTNDPKTRNELYATLIGPAFDEMVDKIVYTYKFTTLPNIATLQDECKIYLVTILPKYNKQKSKAFSYFSVITKNWFIHKVKKQSKKRRTEMDLVEELPKDLELKYLSTTNPYAKEREQFGKPISSYQLIQAKLADMATNCEVARRMTLYAAYLESIGAECQNEAAMTKLFCTNVATQASLDAFQIHGGYGFMQEYTVNRFFREAKMLEIGEGTNEIMKLFIAKKLGC